MQFIKHLLILLCMYSQSGCAVKDATPVDSTPLTLIVYQSQTQSESSDGSRSSSRTSSALLERHLGNRDGGLELEYSYPQTQIPANEAWKLPARVFTIPGASITLLNEPEIAERLAKYLDKHPDIRKKCGESVFTWTAFEIHCNTRHVIDVLKNYNLHLGAPYEGKLYEEPGTLAPAPLKLKSSDNKNPVYQAKLVLDPKYLQAGYEEGMKQVAKISGKRLSSVMNSSLNLSGDGKPVFSGTRLLTIEMNPAGRIVQLQRETTIIIKGGGDFQKTQTIKEAIRRRAVD